MMNEVTKSKNKIAEYVSIFEEALKKMKETGEVDFELMGKSPYPGNLTHAVTAGDYNINREAYSAFNLYVRKAHKLLFPTEYVKRFDHDPRVEVVKKKFAGQLTESLKSMRHNVDYDFNLEEKRTRDLRKPGTRARLPGVFFEEAYQEMLKENSWLKDRFLNYVGMLIVAAHQKDVDYRVTHNLPAEDIALFLEEKKNENNQYPLRLEMNLFVGNIGNYSDLFAALVHAKNKVQGAQLALRQFFLDEDGKEMVAKCGFSDAFANHIVDIVLAER
jgi:hypothetical protein